MLIRGLKDVYSDLNSFIEDFYSPENTYKRAKEKLLTGEYSDSSSRYFKFSTQYKLELYCCCSEDKKACKYALLVPVLESGLNNIFTGCYIVVDEDGNYITWGYFNGGFYDKYENLIGALNKIKSRCNSSTLVYSINNLSVYFVKEYLIGIVNNEIVFMFIINNISSLDVDCSNNKLTVHYINETRAISKSIRLEDYSIID